MKLANSIFNKLWDIYTNTNPSVKKVYNSFVNAGETVVNDHIAFRTFNDPRINISIIEKPFIEVGYVAVNSYTFETKKLVAKHYENIHDRNLPRIFISELLLNEFSNKFQKIISDRLNSVSSSIYKQNDLIYLGSVWEKPSFKTYNALREESEYGAWLYVFGFRANHFTVSINALKKLNTIEKVNQHLKQNGFVLNSAGGEIKGSKADLLQQSSIMAEKVNVDFTEGIYEIPGCYYEFAIRYLQTNGKIYNGFIANNANRIFESTNFYKE